MNHRRWHLLLAGLLILVSFALYLVQVIVFRRTEDTFFYMVQDLAFLPVQVLLVTLILNQVLTSREKRSLMKKLNMLIGSFYSEIGTQLIRYSSTYHPEIPALRRELQVSLQWKDKDFSSAVAAIGKTRISVDSRAGNLEDLKRFLEGKRMFLLSLLANPNLLEHDAFTDLLWAVFHLAEELSVRESLEGLPGADYDHLSNDLRRAYTQLLIEWLWYMRHLRHDYPYLFSLAVRMNPFEVNASPVIREEVSA